MSAPNPVHARIAKETAENDVVLYMKGTQAMPLCGFSGAVVHVLKTMGVTFRDVNILEDDELRQGIKEFSNWPTLPQLYVKGEFVGGCDIVREMFSSGELKKLFADKGIAHQSSAA